MINNKLIQCLNSLDKREMTRFREFVYSPYHCKHADTRALISYLSSIYPEFTAKKCERKKIFKILYPQKAHDQQQLSLVFSYAQKLFEKFVINEQIKTRAIENDILLLEWFRNKKQIKFFAKYLTITDKKLQNTAYKGSNFYRWYAQLHQEQYNHQVTTNQSGKLYLVNKQLYLDRYFILEKLRDACEIAVRGNMANFQQEIHLVQEILSEIELNALRYQDNHLLLLYAQLYVLLIGKELDQYHKARATLKRFQAELPQSELQSIYNYLQNHCIARINSGNIEFLSELFSLYQEQLENRLLLIDPFLFEWHYKNIVTLGLKLNQIQWVGNFIEEYKEYLPQKFRLNAYTFNKASYQYAIQNYSAVLKLLTQLEYKQLQYNIGSKILLLRTYYELNEEEALLALTDSFKQYIIRNKHISKKRTKALLNFIKLTRRLQYLKSKKGILLNSVFEIEHQKLLSDIKDYSPVVNEEWLIKKVNEIKL